MAHNSDIYVVQPECGVERTGKKATHGPRFRFEKDSVILAGDKKGVHPLLLFCCCAL